jgi:hypothetical protein
MATIRIKRKPGSSLTWISNALFNLEFPQDQDTFDVPDNYFAYLKPHFDIVEVVDANSPSGKKPCWHKPDTEIFTEEKLVSRMSKVNHTIKDSEK